MRLSRRFGLGRGICALSRLGSRTWSGAAWTVLGIGSCGSPPLLTDGVGDNEPIWRTAFDTRNTGALSAVWGSGPENIFVVGGTPGRGEVYHFDGVAWRAIVIPEVPLLVWVFGFGPDDVYAVGEDGGALRFDGSLWTVLDTGTDVDLWGVWGASPDDLWIVGGDIGGAEPLILHYDGRQFTHVPSPSNDRNASSLFKVWGIGSKVFAVGGNGLILQHENGAWRQVAAGAAADDDFVSLWGTSEDNIVAVGGRGSARIARYDGSRWTTQLFSGTPGLNAVYLTNADEAVVGGANGYAGIFNPASGRLDDESTPTNQCIHAIWGDGTGSFFAVGGTFSTPYRGTALTRTIEDPGVPRDPIRLCDEVAGCHVGEVCLGGVCEAATGCSTDDDCSGDALCDGGFCVPAPCLQNADCGDTATCSEGLCAPFVGDPCSTEADCAIGQACADRVCVPTDRPDIQYWAELGSFYGPVTDRGDVPVHPGFQGGFHTFISFRTVGFPPNAEVQLTVGISLAENGEEIATTRTLAIVLDEIQNGINEARGILLRFDHALPGELDGREAVVSMTVTDAADQSISAALVQNVRLMDQ